MERKKPCWRNRDSADFFLWPQDPETWIFTLTKSARPISSLQFLSKWDASISLTASLSLEVLLMSSPCTPTPQSQCLQLPHKPSAFLSRQSLGSVRNLRNQADVFSEGLCVLCGGHTPAPSCWYLPYPSQVPHRVSLVVTEPETMIVKLAVLPLQPDLLTQDDLAAWRSSTVKGSPKWRVEGLSAQ